MCIQLKMSIQIVINMYYKSNSKQLLNLYHKFDIASQLELLE